VERPREQVSGDERELYVLMSVLLDSVDYEARYSVVMNLAKYVMCTHAEDCTPPGTSPIPRYQHYVDTFAKTLRELPSRYALLIKREVLKSDPSHRACDKCDTCKAAKVGEQLEMLDQQAESRG